MSKSLSRLLVVVVSLTGCAPPTGPAAYVADRGAAAEAVCVCKVLYGRDVESCFYEFDSLHQIAYTGQVWSDDGTLECVERGLQASGVHASEDEAVLDCWAAAARRYEACYVESRCERVAMRQCDRRHDDDRDACGVLSADFTVEAYVCGREPSVDNDPATTYVNAIGRMLVASSDGPTYRAQEFFDCARPIVRAHADAVRDHALCVVPIAELRTLCLNDLDYHDTRGGEEPAECVALDRRFHGCPPMPEQLGAELAACW